MCCLYRQIWEITPLLKWSPRPWGQILVKCCWIKEKVNNWDVFNVTATKILKHCKQKPWETGVKMCRKSMQWCFEYEWQMGATLRWKNKTRKQTVRNPQLLTLHKIFIAHLKSSNCFCSEAWCGLTYALLFVIAKKQTETYNIREIRGLEFVDLKSYFLLTINRS